MFNYYIDVDVLVNGKAVKQYSHQGKVFIEAKNGTEYSLRVKNNSTIRRLVVVAIDGINVIDGKAGGQSDQGYIVNGFSSMEIKGFRTSNDEVHPFKFNHKSRSYARKSEETQGDTSNCGIIGIRVYAEKVAYQNVTWVTPKPFNPNPYSPQYPYDITWGTYTTLSNSQHDTPPDMSDMVKSSNVTYNCNLSQSRGLSSDNRLRSFNCASISEPEAVATCDFDMGTEFSKHAVEDKVVEVAFETGGLLTETCIYYASFDSLEDSGVPVKKEKQIKSAPQAFPSRFCKPPK